MSLLGTALHFCEAVVLELQNAQVMVRHNLIELLRPPPYDLPVTLGIGLR